MSIILIIAAIAIPDLMRSRMAANESSAVGSVRSINTAMVTYDASFPDTGYAATLSDLGGTVAACAPGSVATVNAACLIDSLLSVTQQKAGYSFAAVGAPSAGATTNDTYTVTAVPLSIGATGNRGFYSDQSGVIYYSLDGSTPTPASSPMQ